MSDDERIDAPADLVTFVSRFVTLFKDGAENCAACCFCGSEGHGLRASDTAWRTFCCCQHEEHGGDAAGFYASWTGTTREEAVVALANGAGLPDAKPPVQVPLRVLPFWGVHALAKHPDARVWIHQLSGSVIVWRELLPDRVHLGLIPGRSWAELDIVALRHIVLVPEATEEGRALMRTLADCLYLSGHKKVMRLDTKGELPPDADAYGWAKVRSKPYPPPDEGQSALTNEAATQEPDREPRPLNPAEHAAAASPLNAVPDVVSAAGGPSPPASTPGPHPSKAADVKPQRATGKGNGGAGPPLTPEQRVAQQHAQAVQAVLDGMVYTCIANVRPEAVKWLWPGRIPLGELSMIVGDPGLGKSQICSSLAAIVTNGGLWPVDRTPCELGSVLILSAEDNIKHTIRPRLDAAGADVSKCHTLQAIKRVSEEGKEYEGGFNLAEDLAKLAVLMDHLRDVRLVIIDPVSAYMGSTDSHKNAEVRGMLAPLTALAGSRKAAFVLVSHLTKAQSPSALMRVQGSIAFAALCRAVWGVTRDQDSQTRRLFMPLKNNLGQDKSGLAYSIESTYLEGIEEGEDQISTSRIMWETEPVEMGADEAFGVSLSHEERSEQDDAKEFLIAELANGPVRSSEVTRNAKAAGHSHMTLSRAKKSLGIISEREGFGKGALWYWRLKPEKRMDEPPASWVPD